jgi:hypothetical protein
MNRLSWTNWEWEKVHFANDFEKRVQWVILKKPKKKFRSHKWALQALEKCQNQFLKSYVWLRLLTDSNDFFSIIVNFHYLKTLKGEFEISSWNSKYEFFDHFRNKFQKISASIKIYRLDVSHLSRLCFTGFLLSLISKKLKHFFLENDQKNHISSFSWKFQIRPWESLDNKNKRLLKKTWKSVDRGSQTWLFKNWFWHFSSACRAHLCDRNFFCFS